MSKAAKAAERKEYDRKYRPRNRGKARANKKVVASPPALNTDPERAEND